MTLAEQKDIAMDLLINRDEKVLLKKYQAIAEFLGYQVKEDGTGELAVYYRNIDGDFFHLKALADARYLLSMDALLPVIEKIEGIKSNGVKADYNVIIDRDSCEITSPNGRSMIQVAGGPSKVRRVFDAVFYFVMIYKEKEVNHG